MNWGKRIDNVFIEEPWRIAEIKNAQFKDGTQLHDAFLLGAGDQHQDLMVGYWRKPIANGVKVLHGGKKSIWIEIGEIKLAGTYRKGDEGTEDIQEWVQNCENIAPNGPRTAIGDWNEHHPAWSLRGTSSPRGRYLEHGMTQLGLEVDNTYLNAPIFQRGASQVSRIDLIFKSTDSGF